MSATGGKMTGTESKLILSLINRLGGSLPCNSRGGEALLDEKKMLEQQSDILVKLSETRIVIIMTGLSNLLDSITKSSQMKTGDEDLVSMIIESQCIVMQTMAECLQANWDSAQMNVNPSGKRGSVVSRSHLVEDGLPPSRIDPSPLSEVLVKVLLNQVLQVLAQSHTGDKKDLEMQSLADIQDAAALVTFHISACNFSTVYSRLATKMAYLASSNDENADVGELALVPHLNLNSQRLSEVIDEFARHTPRFKKSALVCMASGLKRAIWNWIGVYPTQFVSLCQSQKRLCSGTERLFDILDGLASDSSKKRTLFWPLQTMLLILCPDIMLNIALNNKEKVKGADSKRKFLDNLKKSLSLSKMADTAAVCYVDICKASCFVSKNDMSALRYLVPSIEVELKERLFNSDKPFISADGTVDTQLTEDCLVSFFRLNHRNVIQSLFKECLDPAIPDVFRLVLVRSMLTIAVQGAVLPWNPTIEVAYTAMAQPLRDLFQEYLLRQRKSSTRKSLLRIGIGSNRGNVKFVQGSTIDHDILLTLLNLFYEDPHLVLQNTKEDASAITSDTRLLLTGLASCLQEANTPLLKQAGIRTLLKLHHPVYMAHWNLIDPMQAFWEISSHVTISMSLQLIGHRVSNTAELMEWIMSLLQYRNEFLRINRDGAAHGSHIGIRAQTISKLEVSFLLHLWNSNTKLVTIATHCLGLLVEESDILRESQDTHGDRNQLLGPNIVAYRELAKTGILKTGRAAQQKLIRALLRNFHRQTAGNVAAWEETYSRWLAQTSLLCKYQVEMPQPETGMLEKKRLKLLSQPSLDKISITSTDRELAEQIAEWVNMTGFLCAMGGVCLLTDCSTTGSPIPLHQTSNSIDMHGGVSMERKSSFMSSKLAPGERSISKFMAEMVELLVCANEVHGALIRETVKECCGMELSPSLYPELFKHLHERMKDYFSPTDEVIPSEAATLFIEQTISIVRHVLDNKSKHSHEHLALADIATLVQQILRYVKQHDSNCAMVRIKTRLCQLVESMMAQREHLSFPQEIKFRNALVEKITSWMWGFATTQLSQGSGDDDVVTERMLRDLDLACMKAISALLDGLPLQPDADSSDVMEAKSQLFFKYFTFFTNLMNNCRAMEVQSTKSTQELASLRSYTVVAMSNLLKANIDSGLTHSLHMGYHDDPKTRTAFMVVLTNILQQGVEFDTLDDSIIAARRDKMIDLCTSYNLDVVVALCNVIASTDSDALAIVLINIMEVKRCLPEFMKSMMLEEIKVNESTTTLFRRNSMCTKLLGHFSRIHGGEYLRQVIDPLVLELLRSNLSYEVDASKANAGDVTSNMRNLIAASQRFLDVIIDSIDMIPKRFRAILRDLSAAVATRFPDSRLTAVGGALFLRFFNPAICSPKISGLQSNMMHMLPGVQRGLLLVTKVLQNLANNTSFSKEAYMLPMNAFLCSNKQRCMNFFAAIAYERIDLDSDVTDSNVDHDFVKEEDAVALHRFLSINMEKLGRQLLTATRRSASESTSFDQQSVKDVSNSTIGTSPPVDALQKRQDSVRSNFDLLSTIVAQLGQPVEPVMNKRAQSSRNELNSKTALSRFDEFMQRNANLNTESVMKKDIFYIGGVSRSKRSVFYWITRRFNPSTIDVDLLMYHVVLTLKPKLFGSFELVLDMSLFTRENEPGLEWIMRLLSVVPPAAADNLAAVYIYNPSTYFLQFLKRISRLIMLSHMHKRVIFIDSLANFATYIDPKELQLPSSTKQMEDNMKIFHNVTYLIGKFIPVTLLVGPEMFHVLTTERHKVLGHATHTRDIYLLADLEKIQKLDETTFAVKCNRGLASLAFTSAEAVRIIQALESSKARWDLSKPECVTTRKIRPNDVPGTLLNMALLNLGSYDPALRLAAYNLLFAVTVAFSFDIEGQLLEAKGLCIPANNTNFIIRISAKLAQTESHLTLEYLNECLLGFSKSTNELKHLCLEYMAPWLPNLALFCKTAPSDGSSQSKVDKVHEGIVMLINMTCDEREMYPSIQSKVWNTLGEVDELIDKIIDAFVLTAVSSGLGSARAETMADTAVTLASANPLLVAGKLITRLRLAVHDAVDIAPTSFGGADDLCKSPRWTEVAILSRFLLMLSFNNRLNVTQNLADLLFIVPLLVAVGPPIIRSTIHALTVNIIQSLCTSLSLTEESMNLMRIKLDTFSLPQTKLLFGVSTAQRAQAVFEVDKHNLRVSSLERVQLASVETVTSSLLDVLNTCQHALPNQSMLVRWTSLTVRTCFESNHVLQPRAIVVLGVILTHVSDDGILTQLLTLLAESLRSLVDVSMVQAIFMCFARLHLLLPRDSRFARSMFWLATAVLQTGIQDLFAPALALLEENLQHLLATGAFEDESLSQVFMTARLPLASVLEDLDRTCCISFNTNFSFALAATLIRGYRHSSPMTKAVTIRVLTTLLGIGGKNKCGQLILCKDILGYLAALLPVAEESRAYILQHEDDDVISDNVLALSGSPPVQKYSRLFNLVSDVATSALLITLMGTILSHAENDLERLFIYEWLADAAIAFPNAFSLIHDIVLPKITGVVSQSQDPKLIEAVHGIVKTIFAKSSSVSSDKLDPTILSEIGFAALVHAGGFETLTKSANLTRTHIVARLIDSILYECVRE